MDIKKSKSPRTLKEIKNKSKEPKHFQFTTTKDIKKEVRKKGGPLNKELIEEKEEAYKQQQKELKPKKNLKYLFFKILNKIRDIPSKFSNDLPYNLKSLYWGILGTMVGFGFAILLFPTRPGLFAVFFTTIFLTPFIQKQIKYNEILIGRTEQIKKDGVTITKFHIKHDSKFSFKDFYLENRNILNTYLNFFLGIMLVIICLIAIIPQSTSQTLFSDQGWDNKLLPSKNIGFEGQNKNLVFAEIFTNNLSVLIVTFVIALVFPLGAAMIIVWNAIFWGVVFTQYALTYSSLYSVAFVSVLLPLLLSVATHMILEIISYFFGAMSGNLLAIGFKREKLDSERLFKVIKYCTILLLFGLGFLFLGIFTEVYLFDFLKNFFFGLF
ncbi:MAG: stage II sporulation protein M [archaeon]